MVLKKMIMSLLLVCKRANTTIPQNNGGAKYCVCPKVRDTVFDPSIPCMDENKIIVPTISMCAHLGQPSDEQVDSGSCCALNWQRLRRKARRRKYDAFYRKCDDLTSKWMYR